LRDWDGARKALKAALRPNPKFVWAADAQKTLVQIGGR